MSNLVKSLFFIGAVSLLSCKSSGGGSTPTPTPVVPVSTKIAKSWTALSVKEGGITVYTKGAASNTRNYAAFRLVLSQPSSANLTEWDNASFSGQYALANDAKITLSSLTPQPTGTGGMVEYTIGSITDTQMILTRTTTNAKTGNTINEYTLSNQ